MRYATLAALAAMAAACAPMATETAGTAAPAGQVTSTPGATAAQGFSPEFFNADPIIVN